MRRLQTTMSASHLNTQILAHDRTAPRPMKIPSHDESSFPGKTPGCWANLNVAGIHHPGGCAERCLRTRVDRKLPGLSWPGRPGSSCSSSRRASSSCAPHAQACARQILLGSQAFKHPVIPWSPFREIAMKMLLRKQVLCASTSCTPPHPRFGRHMMKRMASTCPCMQHATSLSARDMMQHGRERYPHARAPQGTCRARRRR